MATMATTVGITAELKPSAAMRGAFSFLPPWRVRDPVASWAVAAEEGMMRILAMVMALVLWAGPSMALQFQDCTKREEEVAMSAISGARDMIKRASARVGDTEEYVRWFGPFRTAQSEELRGNLKRIDRALTSPQLMVMCPDQGVDGCDMGTFAYVYPDRPFRVHLCAPFFNMPSSSALVPSLMAYDSGTREGTIIHEVSHFERTAGTDDICYNRSECRRMTVRDPDAALTNADNYQYFTEDVMFAWRREQNAQRGTGPIETIAPEVQRR